MQTADVIIQEIIARLAFRDIQKRTEEALSAAEIRARAKINGAYLHTPHRTHESQKDFHEQWFHRAYFHSLEYPIPVGGGQ